MPQRLCNASWTGWTWEEMARPGEGVGCTQPAASLGWKSGASIPASSSRGMTCSGSTSSTRSSTCQVRAGWGCGEGYSGAWLWLEGSD